MHSDNRTKMILYHGRSLYLTCLFLLIGSTPHPTHALSMTMKASIKPTRKIVILGLGPVGTAIAQHCATLKQEDRSEYAFESITGTVNNRMPVFSNTTPENRINILPFDSISLENSLRSATHVINTIPPQTLPHPWGEPNKYNDIPLFNQLQEELWIPPPNQPCWVGYVSTTSVYGAQPIGSVVEESSSLLSMPGTKAHDGYRIAGERMWEVACKEIRAPLRIFRCAGIYGGRSSALHTVLKRGVSNDADDDVEDEKEEEIKTNRIHVDDIARAVVSSMLQHDDYENGVSSPCEIYNLADDEPAPRAVVMRHAQSMLLERGWDGKAVGAGSSSISRQAGKGSSRMRVAGKIISNNKMKRDLLSPSSSDDDGLLYPSYREGLQNILDTSDDFAFLRNNDGDNDGDSVTEAKDASVTEQVGTANVNK